MAMPARMALMAAYEHTISNYRWRYARERRHDAAY